MTQVEPKKRNYARILQQKRLGSELCGVHFYHFRKLSNLLLTGPFLGGCQSRRVTEL